MKNDLHILIISGRYPDSDDGIKGKFVQDQANALSSVGVKVGVINLELRSIKYLSARFKGKDTSVEDGVVVNRSRQWLLTPGNDKLKYKTYLKYLGKEYDNYVSVYGKPDLIHGHVAYYAGYAASILSKSKDVPFFLTEHSSSIIEHTYSEGANQIIKEAYSNCLGLIAVSEFLKTAMKAYVPDKPISVVPNVINTDFFKSKSTIDRNEFVSIGSLTPVKNHKLLLESFARVEKDYPDVRLTIIGSGENRYVEELKELSRKLKISDKISWKGALSSEQVLNVFTTAGIYLLTSRTETFSVATCEAMSCGMPVVVTPCGGPEEFVLESCGKISESHSVADFSKSIVSVYENYDHYNRDEISEITRDKFSFDSVSKQLIEIYEQKA